MMMAMEEAQWEGADVSFVCPVCEKDVGGSTDLPVVYDNGSEEHLPVTVTCFGCNTCFDGEVIADWSRCEITLHEYPDVEIDANPIQGSEFGQDDDHDYYEWLELQERETRPVFMAFSKTLEDVKALAAEVTNHERPQMLARMLLAQSITALEVFLADSLISTVAGHEAAQARLLRSKSLKIGEINVQLSDLIGVVDVAKTMLMTNLQAVSFHNLAKVASLYRIGLKFDIMPKGEALECIQTGIRLRHDCVHRNGIDRNTGEMHQIDRFALLELNDALMAMGTTIDEQVVAFEAQTSEVDRSDETL